MWLVLGTGCTEQPPAPQAGSYSLTEVSLNNIELETAYPANIAGQQDIEIFPKITGFIERVCVREGEEVRKGQTLFILEQVQHQAALQTARANVEAARAQVATAQLNYDSKRELFANNVVSQFDLSTAQNNLLTAKAQMAQAEAQEVDARNNLSYTLVKSPADGIVGTLPYREGTLVNPSMPRPLTTVSDNSAMHVYFSMPESRLLGMIRRYGSTSAALEQMPDVTLGLSDGSVYPLSGRIETISGVIDPSTGAVSVRAGFPNPGGLLRSGGSGSVIIPSSFENALIIPQSATFEIQDKIYVYRVDTGTARQTLITVAKVNNGRDYIVESGLKAGDMIITEGVGMLRDGMDVSPADWDEKPGPDLNNGYGTGAGETVEE
ncbi:MAG: efflux RND transporter periplasmic adaptor subunit [Alistipes sp.]|nr:efflux RND transporter periplasmic adaptor subunit [Alistipes sp.]